MASLDNHFGARVALPEGEREAVTRYLVQNAGDRISGELASAFMARVHPRGTPRRLTENPEFIHEHRKTSWYEVGNSAIGSIVNCRACHRKAEKGRYDD